MNSTVIQISLIDRMCHKIKKTERQNQTHMKSNHILTNLGNYITTASGRQEEQEPKQ